MGGSASKGPGRLVAAIRPVQEAAESLQHLPANSAVRRDAEAAVELEKRRVELETEDVSMEELSSKDEEMIALMNTAMKSPDGEIRFKEHVLPLTEDSTMVQGMVSQVKTEQLSTEKLYAAREASEAFGAGRVSHEQFMAIMKLIQANRGSEEVLQSLAAQHVCDVSVLRDVAEHFSLPTVLTEALGENFARKAKWQ